MVNTRKLKAAIVESGYTQTAIAERMGMSKNTFNMKVNGRKKFYADEAAWLCDFLHIDNCTDRCEIFLS